MENSEILVSFHFRSTKLSIEELTTLLNMKPDRISRMIDNISVIPGIGHGKNNSLELMLNRTYTGEPQELFAIDTLVDELLIKMQPSLPAALNLVRSKLIFVQLSVLVLPVNGVFPSFDLSGEAVAALGELECSLHVHLP